MYYLNSSSNRESNSSSSPISNGSSVSVEDEVVSSAMHASSSCNKESTDIIYIICTR